ncbi:hypothetical protein GCM10029978_018940 [Actinoallomurus acanthiterrae]
MSDRTLELTLYLPRPLRRLHELVEAMTPLGRVDESTVGERLRVELKEGDTLVSVTAEIGETDIMPGDDYTALGFPPGMEINVSTAVTTPDAARALARLALALARRYAAVIDTDGVLEVSPKAHPGRLGLLRFEMMDGTEFRYVSVFDADFLQAWIDDPAFHLIAT